MWTKDWATLNKQNENLVPKKGKTNDERKEVWRKSKKKRDDRKIKAIVFEATLNGNKGETKFSSKLQKVINFQKRK